MKMFLIITYLSFCFSANAQNKKNTILKNKLDSIYILDQKYREAQIALSKGSNADSIAAIFGRSSQGLFMFLVNDMQRVDSLNLIEIKSIIKNYGYPGKSLVGVPTNEVAWNVIQHSSHIKDFIKIIAKAANQNEIPFILYGKMLDRLFMEKGEEQIYGTQIYGMTVIDKESGQKVWRMFVWPIKNAIDINYTRKKAGFQQSIQDYAKTFGVTYRALTLKDVQSFQN